jgi:gliding motility-associated-like protein
MLRKVLSTVFALMFIFKVNGQLTVNTNAPYNSVQYLVENVLLGEGVVAFNFTSTGSMAQIGYFEFEEEESPIGIGSGIVMSTGLASHLAPGSGNASTSVADAADPNDNDPDLLLVAQSVPDLIGVTFNPPGSINDVSIIEFDFIPTGDTIRFNFIFASREYPGSATGTNWLNSTFNDAFGFFVSGPGIDGDFSAPPGFGQSNNIAVIPNTNIPITVSSVHGGAPLPPNPQTIAPQNEDFFVSNIPTGGVYQDINFNGYTTVLTAMSPVTCGEVYHIKLAIGDGQDRTLDSVVLLEAQSFSSEAINFAAEFNFSANDSTVFEGCGGTVGLSRLGNINNRDSLFVSFVDGSEITAEDFSSTVPDVLVFEPGDIEVFFEFELVRNNIEQGIREAKIEFLYDGGCTGEVRDTLVFYVQDAPLLEVDAGPDLQKICPFDEFDLTATFDTANVVIPVSINWSVNTAGNVFSNDTTVTVNPSVDRLYITTITDECNGFARDSVWVFAPTNLPLTYNLHPDTAICFGTNINLWVEPLEGVPPYEVEWLFNGETTDTINVSPPNDRLYRVRVTDFCDTERNDGVFVTVQEPIANFSYEYEDDLATVFTNLSEGNEFIVDFLWNFGDGNTSNEENPTYTFPVPDRYNVTLKVITDIGCVDSITRQFLPQLSAFLPSAFTPNNDGLNDTWKFTGVGLRELEVVVYDRWGSIVFQSSDPNFEWDGTTRSGEPAKNGVYVYRIRAYSFGADAVEKIGNVTLLR